MSDPLCHPVPPCRNGLDLPNIKTSDSGGTDLEAWCLDVWMLEGLKWEEEIGRTSHTLKLQELGGYIGAIHLHRF